MILQASTVKRLDQTLTINGDINADARSSLQESLQQMLTVIDETLWTHQQELWLFKHGVCPRLSWPLFVEDFPISYSREQKHVIECTVRYCVLPS